MVAMLALHQEGTAPGLVIVSDMGGCQFGHIAKLGLVHLKKFFFYFQVSNWRDCFVSFQFEKCFQEAMPVRIKGLHFINCPSFMDKILALIKPFMKKELLNMVRLHKISLPKNKRIFCFSCIYTRLIIVIYTNSYQKNVCRKTMEAIRHRQPNCLVTFAKSKKQMTKRFIFLSISERQKKLFLDNACFFVEEQKQLVDESKRPGKPKNESEVFGVEGTFKKLDID